MNTSYQLLLNKKTDQNIESLFIPFKSAVLEIFPACTQVIATYQGSLLYEFINPTPKVDPRMPIVNAFYSILTPFIPHLKDTKLNQRGTAWNGRSVAKCVLSALTGIALEKGIIKSLDSKLGECLPAVPPDKKDITLRQLLTMTSGMPFTDKIPEMPRWLRSRNWVDHLLSLPLVCHPGECFAYSTGNSHLLAAILHRSLKDGLYPFAQKELFNPLGIEKPYWERDPQGVPFGGANLFLTIREMTKLGYLILQEGFWEGRQVLPRRWVIESTTPRVHAKDQFEYGYAWWIRYFEMQKPTTPIKVVCACGWAGQRIYIVPQMESVVAVTSKANLWANTENLDATFGDKMLLAIKEYIQCAK